MYKTFWTFYIIRNCHQVAPEQIIAMERPPFQYDVYGISIPLRNLSASCPPWQPVCHRFIGRVESWYVSEMNDWLNGVCYFRFTDGSLASRSTFRTEFFVTVAGVKCRVVAVNSLPAIYHRADYVLLGSLSSFRANLIIKFR